jgi:hypothetical protein
VELDSMTLGGHSVSTVRKAILDTGTSVLAGPTDEVRHRQSCRCPPGLALRPIQEGVHH